MSVVVAEASDCGTYAGYQTHRRRRQRPCDECRQACAEYMRDYRSSRPEYRDHERLYARASDRARRRLAQMYQSDYVRLLDEELARDE